MKSARPEKGQFKKPKDTPPLEKKGRRVTVQPKAKEGDKRIGNKFWMFRTKHGRDSNFESPEALWQSACEYFEWAEKQRWNLKEAIKSGEKAGKVMNVPVQSPFSMDALWLGIGSSRRHWGEFKNSVTYSEQGFSDIVTRIEQIVYLQKITGASVGAYNANIIARELGLADKQELTGQDGTPLVPQMSDEDIERRLRVLEIIANGTNGIKRKRG